MSANNPKLYEIKPKSMSSEEIERWLRSVQADLEEPGVFVPEMNSIRWDWDAEENKDKPTFAFLIPVAYRGSIANLGINILHEEMNRYRNQICERIYFPYPKLFRRLIKNNIPLFSNESFHQAKDFEVLGISSYYPLQFLAFPRLLKMSGMEPLAKDRKEEDPIIMFGGVAAFNPAPVADFVDAVNLGDGEKVLADAVQMVHDLRKEGKSKYDILVELQKKVPGVYVPALYKEEYYPADDPHRPNQFKAHVPLRDDIPERIKKVTCEIKDVRPVSKIIQPNSLGDDMSSGAVEITRGCGHKSFVKGTPVSTNRGLVPIEQVTSNDLVLVENGDGTREFVAQRGAFCTGTKQVARFAIPGTNKQFICTVDHRFAVKNFDGSEGLTSYVEAGHISENPNNLDYSLYVPSVAIGEFDRGAYDAGLAISSSQSLEFSTENAASFVLGLMRSCFTTNVDRAGYLIGASFDLLSEQAKNAIANALTLCGIRWEEGTASIVVLRTDLHKLVSIQNEYASEVTPVQQFNVYDESPALYLEKIEDLGEQEVWDLETSVHNFYANGTLVHNCSFCFDADTMIATSKGLKRIADITSDDAIVSLDENGNRRLSKTDGAVKTRVAETFVYKTKSAKVCCTSNHKFLTKDLTWHEAQEVFEQGLILYHVNETFIEREEAGVQPVYDMTVVDTHCYFANGFAVHNCEGSFRSMPYRERDLEDIYKAIDDTLLDSGSSSLTPYAFNLSDHHRIFDILQYAMSKWPTRIGMSSQHINHFSEQMADMALMTGTRSITIALESADPVMRRRIGKTLTDETVERVFRLIIRKGFTSIKVYMISNLPMEDDESLHEIENFSRKLIRWQIEEQSPNFASKEEAHAYVSRPEFDEEIDKFAASCKLAFRNKTKIIPEGEEYWNLHLKYKLTTRIKFSYTSFNGKAHTPMQWAQVLPLDEEGFPSIRRDMHTIFDVIQACGHSFRMSGDLEISTLNQVLSYADRRFSQVLIDLCNDERFNYMGTLVAGSNNTMKDFADLMACRGFDFKFFYREKELDEPFPWDFINMGVTRAYLEKRWQMYKSATDDIRCQEECTKCGGCTKVSRELFKRYWTEGLEEKKYQFKVTPIIKRENTCKIRFRFRMRPEYRWLYGFNKKQWLRRAFYRAGFPIRTNISLASDGIEFNNFTYGADYGEVWLYSKNFDKNNIVERLNATFDEAEPLLQFEDAMVGESASPFKEDVGSIAYSVQIPSKMYTKATLDGLIQSLLNKDEIIIKQKVASSIKRDSTETVSIDVKDKLSQLFSVGDEGFTTVYFKLTYGINPYSLLVTLLNTSLARCKKFPIEVRDYLGRDNEDSFDMFAEICEECGEPIERNIFDDVIGDKYCLKCATLHEKRILVANLDAEDTEDDSDLDDFDLSFFEDDDMADTNEELHGDE